MLSGEVRAGKAAPAATESPPSSPRKRAKRTVNQTEAVLSSEFLAASAEFLCGNASAAEPTAAEALDPAAPEELVPPVPVGVMEIWRCCAHPDEVNFFLPP